VTLKAMKFVLKKQASIALGFVVIYALVVAILSVVFYFIEDEDMSWVPDITLIAPKIFLLILGIVYPLTTTRLYIAQGITRKQFFWANVGSISIISLFLLLPIVGSEYYVASSSLLSAITHYIQLPLFYLLGWTAIVGFQLKNIISSILGVSFAVIMLQIITTLPETLVLSDIITAGISLSVLVVVLLILPHVVSKIQLKG